MASITPVNGRATFVAAHDPHTYWELNSTNLGTNFGDDTSGNDDNTAVGSGDISTQESYEGMSTNNNPPNNGWMDIYIVTDFGCLLYIPSDLGDETVYGIFHNGGGTHAQACFLRQSDTFGGVEVAITHNASGTPQDWVRILIPDADLDGWHCISGQFASSSGNQGDMAGWLNGSKVVSGTRGTQLSYGSGNPQLGDSNADHPLASNCLDPSSYTGGNWGAESTINGSGILIANFWCDNPNQDNSAPDGLGDTAHSDFATSHIGGSVPTITDVETDETFRDQDTGITITGTNFEASQGTGKVELASSSDYGTATLVEQTTTSWGDTSVDFTVDLSTLTPGTLYLFVTNDSGDRSSGFEVTVQRAVAFVLSASANVASGGEATTALLSAPSGKTTGDFTTGRRWDDENGTDAIDIASDEYTELEWWIEATAEATASATYQFRVVWDDTALDTYTVTPQWTIGTATPPPLIAKDGSLTVAGGGTLSVMTDSGPVEV